MINSKHGFSIISVLVGFALLGIFTMVFMTSMNNNQKGQNTLKNQQEFEVLRSSIKQILDNPTFCEKAFLNADNSLMTFSNAPNFPGDEQNINKIRFGKETGSPVVAKIDQNIGGGLEISKMAFVQIASRDETDPAYFYYPASLLIVATKGKETFGGNKLSNKDNLFFTTLKVNRANDRIVGCTGSGGVTPQIGLGINQKWYSLAVGVDRSANVDYQNSTDSPISVQIDMGDNSSIHVSEDKVTWIQLNTPSSDRGLTNFIVPSMHWYRYTDTANPTFWSELRE